MRKVNNTSSVFLSLQPSPLHPAFQGCGFSLGNTHTPAGAYCRPSPEKWSALASSHKATPGRRNLHPPRDWGREERLNLPTNAECSLRHLRAGVWATHGMRDKGPTVPGAFPSSQIQHISNQNRCMLLCQAHWPHPGARRSSGKLKILGERVMRNTHNIVQGGAPSVHKRAFISSLFSLNFLKQNKGGRKWGEWREEELTIFRDHLFLWSWIFLIVKDVLCMYVLAETVWGPLFHVLSHSHSFSIPQSSSPESWFSSEQSLKPLA